MDKKFPERLLKCRKEKGVTQKEAAQSTNIGERTYQRYEAGGRAPTLEATIALADYFEVSLDYLVGRSDVPERH